MIINKENILQSVSDELLLKSALTQQSVLHRLSSMMVPTVQYADLYFESMESESWYLEDGKIKDGSFYSGIGVGVRAISGEKTGFAYADDISEESLKRACDTARRIAKSGVSKKIRIKNRVFQSPSLYVLKNPLLGKSSEAKVELLRLVDKEARLVDPRIKEVRASLVASHKIFLVAGSDGVFAADVQPMVRLSVKVIALKKDRREAGSSGGGGRVSYHNFFKDDFKLAKEYAREASRIALFNLDAVDAPAGPMPVVLAPGWPGVLLHEAVGHGLEGDFNRKKLSAFSGRIGQTVASKVCTIVDHGNKRGGHRGSINIDDEGTKTQKTILIEKGVLAGYMQDKHNAFLMNTKSTGNGRRESYDSLPIPRMTNTYMLPGKYDPNEIVSSVKKGIYAKSFNGGQVDITSGKFVFAASEAYLIENGKITKPVKGATLIGDGPTVLTRVSMVGNDLSLDKGIGTCGKDGQSIPVCVGQPTLKVDEITVGGSDF